MSASYQEPQDFFFSFLLKTRLLTQIVQMAVTPTASHPG